MSEDWIPVPEIENVLIVLATLAENPEEISCAPVMPLLQQLKSWHNGSVYVFHNPPEAGEVLEDVDGEMASRFALAAQMSDDPEEICRDAFRRVFSRATVQRVVLVSSESGSVTIDKIDRAFGALDQADTIWAGEWPGEFIVGMRAYHEEIFSVGESENSNLRKRLEAVTGGKGLRFLALTN